MKHVSTNVLEWIHNYVPKIIVLLLLYLMVGFVQLPIRFINDNASVLHNTVYVIIYFVSFIVAILIARKVYLDHTHHPIRKVTKQDLWLIIKVYALALVVEFILNYLNYKLNGQLSSKNNDVIMQLLERNRTVLIIMTISMVCLSPILEEFVFRGYIMDAFFGPKRLWWPMIVSGLVFASGHLTSTWISFAVYVSLGMFLGYVYKRSNNIRASMLMHALNNFLSVIPLLIMILR
ncbi:MULTISPECIES: CPBP family intramembrane glutamic endopeptidase [Lactobacillaceae]|uniref:CPBP family intramembrane metalloprotease n=1 Tax=Acetilactobacillus jinshanensis TaxID=1720083 RepID=A0A4P6ZJD9_9LACO|nr:type II CAAX endopeptidase family protein [Acetilactobacillus jinshanensis]QBP17633.1 CPBP family intramembrane metalloprotease [Acetilactobacillus jinshanensis]URL61824.1 CPBP family intramembrane metalloprotease [uncultured bacterium]